MTLPVFDEVTALLEQADSYDLLPVLCERLGSLVGGRAQVWLVDYRQQALHATSGSKDAPDSGQPVEGTLVGRSFAAQVTLLQAVDLEVLLLVPLTTRGRRQGVLELRLQAAPSDTVRADLERLAPLLAQALCALGPLSGPHERSRRQRPMTVAAELQWSLLPGTAYHDADITVAGLLEPAYSIAGDAFDWTRDRDVLHVVALDGTGRGVPASLTTALAMSALRNARFAEVSLADQAALADQAVYAHHGGDAFVSALLFQFDLAQGVARVVDAGSPQLYRVREGKPSLIELEPQLPLGMFEETVYEEQHVDVARGDRFVIVSDGVHGTRTRSGSDFADSLIRGIRDCGLLSPAETVRRILRELHAEHHDQDLGDGLDDDALVVCVDVHPGDLP